MPVASLNIASTQNNYVDALTVNFPRGRPSFALNVFNAGVFYTLFYIPTDGQQKDPVEVASEHHLAPSLSNFDSPEAEGLPPNTLFGGIKIRSAVAGVPAVVTVA